MRRIKKKGSKWVVVDFVADWAVECDSKEEAEAVYANGREAVDRGEKYVDRVDPPIYDEGGSTDPIGEPIDTHEPIG